MLPISASLAKESDLRLERCMKSRICGNRTDIPTLLNANRLISARGEV